MQPNDSPRLPAVFAGAALIAGTIIAFIAVAHHPTIARARDAADVMQQIAAKTASDQWVHGTVIACIGAMLYGVSTFARRRGLDRDAVVAGLIAYAIGCVGAIAAAMIDGFLIPALGARYAHGSADEVANALRLVTFCALAIQVFTKLWLSAIAVALALWSIPLFRLGTWQRATAALGIVSAVAMPVLAATSGALNPHTLGVVMLAQAVWNVAVGIQMLLGDL